MSSNNFPSEMIFDKELSDEQLELLKNQYRKFLALRQEKFDINQYQLYLDKDKKAYFPKGTLIHGTSASVETLRNISETGILACEFLGKVEDGETFYCADFHRVPCDTLVSVYDSEFVPDWKTPFNRVNNNIAFVINPSSKLGGLLYYDLLDSKFDNNLEVRNIINTSAIPRGFLDENRGKGSAILGGIPANAISGIVIGDKLLEDDSFIKEIQNLFPSAYLITRNGNILKDRSNTVNIDDYEELSLRTARMEVLNAALTRNIHTLRSESQRKQEELTKYMGAVMEVVPPLLQAKILLKFGYQSIPYGLLSLLSEEEKSELGINDKKIKK